MDVVIASFPDSAAAGMFYEILVDRGFHPRPINLSSNISLAGADLWYYIYVPEDEAERARKVLSEFVDEKNLIQTQ